jgi:hypothetical protein
MLTLTSLHFCYLKKLSAAFIAKLALAPELADLVVLQGDVIPTLIAVVASSESVDLTKTETERLDQCARMYGYKSTSIVFIYNDHVQSGFN